MGKTQGKKTVSKVERIYSVTATVRNCELVKAKSAIRLVISEKASKLGELEIGQGGLYWWGHKRKRSKRIPWRTFSEIMNKRAYGSRA
jgi:hypothetical protein